MDIGFFLRDRIAFIRQFYETAALPFLERKRKIEAREDPYVPPYSEDGEPPYLADWTEADDSIQVLGHTSISMLAAALRVYLKAWVPELGVPVDDSFKADFNKGWINGYKAFFSARFGIHFENSPAHMSLLEEIALARNRIQHPDHIAQHRPEYAESDFKKLPRAFFINEVERGLFLEGDMGQMSWLLRPSVHITRDKLFAAIAEVEKFSAWFEDEIAEHLS